MSRKILTWVYHMIQLLTSHLTLKKKKNGRQKGEVLFSLKPASYVYFLLHITQEFFRAALNTLWLKENVFSIRETYFY